MSFPPTDYRQAISDCFLSREPIANRSPGTERLLRTARSDWSAIASPGVKYSDISFDLKPRTLCLAISDLDPLLIKREKDDKNGSDLRLVRVERSNR